MSSKMDTTGAVIGGCKGKFGREFGSINHSRVVSIRMTIVGPGKFFVIPSFFFDNISNKHKKHVVIDGCKEMSLYLLNHSTVVFGG
jgi:hypothetical protein